MTRGINNWEKEMATMKATLKKVTKESKERSLLS